MRDSRIVPAEGHRPATRGAMRLLGAAFSALVCLGTAKTSSAADVARQPMAEPTSGEGSIFVSVQDALVTARTRDASRAAVLRQIATQAALSLDVPTPLEDRVTVSFSALPLDQALRRILATRNFVLVYSEAGRLTAVKVILEAGRPPHETPGVLREPARHGATHSSLDALRQALENRVVAVREAAVRELAQIGGDQVMPLLEVALGDQDPSIREAAVETLGDIGGERVLPSLAAAVRDPVATVREMAVRGLGKVRGPTAIALLVQSAHDSDPAVRQEAEEILGDLFGTPDRTE